jgi:anaerobic carbon-monoxide dehydrogenase iron sulfur subunit
MKLKLDSTKCTACNLCVLACSAKHQSVFNPAKSFIKISLTDLDGLVKKHLSACTLCVKCVKTCPAAAIQSNGKWLTLDLEKCTGCGSCVDACPHGLISLDKDNKAAVPDFCQGSPACIASCPHQAIELTEEKV